MKSTGIYTSVKRPFPIYDNIICEDNFKMQELTSSIYPQTVSLGLFQIKKVVQHQFVVCLFVFF